MQYDNLDPVEALATKVRFCIDNAQGEELLTCLKAADTHLTDRKELMYDTYYAAGEYMTRKDDPYNSILFFNKARKYDSKTIVVFDKLVDAFISFYTPNKEQFIKSDLISLIPPIKGLIYYYNSIAPENEPSKRAEELLTGIAYRTEYLAPEGIESTMTFRVAQLVNALEKEVPMEQVKKEVAKFIADLLKKTNRNTSNDLNNIEGKK
ncbi:MAG: hypothetical protein LWX70_09030 [Sphingobacteriia bacterium]|nr:hypothetical protein [Sphingobacteriia bacterium]